MLEKLKTQKRSLKNINLTDEKKKGELTMNDYRFGHKYFSRKQKRKKEIELVKVFFIWLVLVFLLVSAGGCGGGYSDLTKGAVVSDVQHYVEQIKQYALEYNAKLFHERMKFIDVIWNDSEAGQLLWAEYPDLAGSVALTFSKRSGHERIIVLNRALFSEQSDVQKLITLIHEFYHAVSKDNSTNQHINYTVTNEDGFSMPLSIMNIRAGGIDSFWNEYKDYYLQQLFSMRLDRIWKQ